MMLPMTQEKTTLIAPMNMHIDFVIPDKFCIEECRNFLSLVLQAAIQELHDMPNLTPKFSSFITLKSEVEYSPIRCLQDSISMSLNLEGKIHLEGGGTVITWILNKLFEFR